MNLNFFVYQGAATCSSPKTRNGPSSPTPTLSRASRRAAPNRLSPPPSNFHRPVPPLHFPYPKHPHPHYAYPRRTPPIPQVQEVSLIFIRHGESEWNDIFNKGFKPSFLVRLVGGCPPVPPSLNQSYISREK